MNPGLLLVQSGPVQPSSCPGSHLHIVLVAVGQDVGGELGTVDVGLDPRVLLAWNEGGAREVTAPVLLATAWTLALTDHVSAEVVERVDLEGALPPILLHHHSAEVLGEQLVVGPQVQPEVSGAHRRR